MALIYPDSRKPMLRYNFTAGAAANEPKCTHRMTGKGKVHRVAKDLVQGTMRALDMPIHHCKTAHS